MTDRSAYRSTCKVKGSGWCSHATLVVLAPALLLLADTPADAGHTLAHYPSYYPDEIQIETLDPVAAARGLADKSLHAYVGGTPAFSGAPPAHVEVATSLKSLFVLNLDSSVLPTREQRCGFTRQAVSDLRVATDKSELQLHPYPITPYHADYLHHLDIVEDLRSTTETPLAAVGGARALPGASGRRDIVRPQEVPLERILEGTAGEFAGWISPPWLKQGWFQAYRLLAPALDGDDRREADGVYGQLVRGEATDEADQANLERRLISLLTRDCRRVVVGYSLRKEYANAEFSSGIENLSPDSQSGLNAPIFIRNAKLKDYPWNGSLRLGIPGAPDAAWNPVAGFTDPAGHLVWSAVGDPALMPVPFSASWVANRAQFSATVARGQSGGIRVPEGALLPEPGTGELRAVPARTRSSARITYRATASPFLDGTEMEAADFIYPFILAYRWGLSVRGARPREPALADAAGPIAERLVGLRPVRVDRTTLSIAEGLSIAQSTHVVEIYLRDAPGDDSQLAALAPPWSSVPWHLLALMEEAVDRGYGAFSNEESRRLGVAWLDLVRDTTMRVRLLALAAEFEREGYRPAALRALVTNAAAARRWRALREFGEKHGHLLVTNGPYRLNSWNPHGVTLSAVREASYPLGFGTFDHLVNPPRAIVGELERVRNSILVRADAEITSAHRIERRNVVVREPLTRSTAQGTRGVIVVSRYLLIGPDGTVIRAGKMDWQPDHRFKIEIPEGIPPGPYAVLVGVFLDGNSLIPATRMLRFGR